MVVPLHEPLWLGVACLISATLIVSCHCVRVIATGTMSRLSVVFLFLRDLSHYEGKS